METTLHLSVSHFCSTSCGCSHSRSDARSRLMQLRCCSSRLRLSVRARRTMETTRLPAPVEVNSCGVFKRERALSRCVSVAGFYWSRARTTYFTYFLIVTLLHTNASYDVSLYSLCCTVLKHERRATIVDLPHIYC